MKPSTDPLQAADDLVKAWRSIRPDIYPPYRNPHPEYDSSKEARLEWERQLCVVDAASDNYLRARALSKRADEKELSNETGEEF